jgi:hypothetical protein
MKNNKILLILMTSAAVMSFFWLQQEQTSVKNNKTTPKTLLEEVTAVTTSSNVSKMLAEPSAEQLSVKPLKTSESPQQIPTELAKERKTIKQKLFNLLHCDQTHTCPVDNSDPRASDLLLGQQITEQLNRYTELHLNNDYFDEEAAQMARELINNRDGFVQEAALDLMSAMGKNTENAQALLSALDQGYDAKIMNQAMKELTRYPELNQDIDKLFSENLQTGSLYVAQEIALNILPYLNEGNIDHYIDVANKLPQQSKRADALWSNIKEFKLRQTAG